MKPARTHLYIYFHLIPAIVGYIFCDFGIETIQKVFILNFYPTLRRCPTLAVPEKKIIFDEKWIYNQYATGAE